ncbi:MAG: hypothetical protein ACYTE8_08840 [Planctomycetota bacterium]|jgi:hypothetical protein
MYRNPETKQTEKQIIAKSFILNPMFFEVDKLQVHGINNSITIIHSGGRSTSRIGLFYDKESDDMMTYNSSEAEYGNSFLIGDDAEHLVLGHPHMWKKSGKFYLGYA